MNRFFKKVFFFFLLWIGICLPRANLTIRDIQVGTEIEKTRIVFVLSRPLSLYVQTLNDGLLIRAPEDTFWKIPQKAQVGQGALLEYRLNGAGVYRTCHLVLQPYTRFVGGFLRGNRYILDLVTEEPPPPEPEPEPEPEPLPVIEELPPEPPQPTTVNLQQTLELPQDEINGLTISPKEDGTTWIIINSDKQDFFESQIVDEAKKLYLYLPKINWPSVQTQIINSGAVASYAVDESIPGSSTVIMDLKDTAGIIDLISTSNLDGTYDFVLILANRKATEIEIKKVAEKRLEVKGIVGRNRGVSFKINSPQLVLDPDADSELNVIKNSNQNIKSYVELKKSTDSLFDQGPSLQEKQEPEWVSEERSKLVEK